MVMVGGGGNFFRGNFGGEELVFVVEFWWSFRCMGLPEKQRIKKRKRKERGKRRERIELLIYTII